MNKKLLITCLVVTVLSSVHCQYAEAFTAFVLNDPKKLEAIADATKHTVEDGIDIVRDVAKLIGDLSSKNALVFNTSDENIEWYVYNAATPLPLDTQFTTMVRSHGYGELNTIGWGNIKVYPNNEEPGFILSRGKAYVYTTRYGFQPFPKAYEEKSIEKSDQEPVKQRFLKE